MKAVAHSYIKELCHSPGLERLKINSFFSILLAVAYGLLVSNYADSSFLDFGNYLNYAENASVIASRYVEAGLLTVLGNEPFWLFLNRLLSLYLSPTLTVRTIIFLSATTFSWLMIRHNFRHLIIVLALLFLPQIIKNYIIHIRQGTAIAIFLFGWYASKQNIRLSAFILAAMTHSSFFFVLALLFFNWCYIKLGFFLNLKQIYFGVVGILLGFSTSIVARAIGSRQAMEYSFEPPEVSGAGFALWFLILVTFNFDKKQHQNDCGLAYGILIFYVVNYWTLQMNARIFESGLAILLLAGLSLSGWRKPFFLCLVFSAGLVAWLSRLDNPALGFALSHR